MPSVKLYYSHNLNPRVAVAVAKYLQSPVEFVRASPRNPANTEAFRAINPNALVPVLADGQNTLWETDAIACKLSAVSGTDFWRLGSEMPEMIKWISWSAYHLTSAAGPLYFYRIVVPTFSDAKPDPREMEKALANFREHAATLDGILADRKWLLGDRISYADFRVATPLPFAGDAGMPVEEFPHVKRWHDQLWAIEAWRDPFQGIA
jgi:glutathione S-transferase